MLAYSVIMFLAAAVLLACSAAIYRGRTDLIHDYHRAKVEDKAAYGRAFGKALSVFAAAAFLSGIIGLFASSRKIGAIAIAVMLAGFAAGKALLTAVQRKYNRGIF